MNNPITLIRKVSLLAATLFTFQGVGYAQSVADVNNPIVEMLDSLVSLNISQKTGTPAFATPNAYQPYEIPTYADDIYSKRMEKIQTPIPLVFNEQVKEYIDLYAVKKRQLTERMMGLSTLYFPQFEQILDQQDIPLEFKYLSIVESALNPVAVSRVGATGLWQFMLATGRMYDLKVNSYVDERKDPYKSTLAACQYFKDMYAIYKDWLLVIASYNCGPGNVNKAIARSGGKTTFWEISPYLPQETRGYVPAFIAVTYLMHYTAEHNLNAVSPVINYYDADTIRINHQVSLRQISESLNMSEEMLRYLNPMYKKGIIPSSEEPNVLRLPTNKVNFFLANMNTILVPEGLNGPSLTASANSEDPAYTYVTKTVKKYHKVRRGERLSTLADRYECSVQDIKHWNKLRSTKLASGQRLAVYVSVRQKVVAKNETVLTTVTKSKNDTAKNTSVTSDSMLASTAAPADTEKLASRPSTPVQVAKANQDKFLYHVVQPGDTLWNIAMRYDGVTVKQLRKMNRLNSNALKVGTKLKVQVDG